MIVIKSTLLIGPLNLLFIINYIWIHMQVDMIETNKSQKVLTQAFQAKFSNKKEVFRFLSRDCKVYLPHVDSISIWFMRDIVQGKRNL